MKATLLFPNREIVERYYVPLIYTACRTCYSELEPDEIFRRAETGEIDPAKMQKLISGVIESGHGSTIEHVVFTFGISGVSRTLSHQLVRHRAGVAFDQQSQRYVAFKGAATMLPGTIAEADPDLRARFEEQVDGSLGLYGELLAAGIPGEDARFVFPNATRTNLVMTANLRALIHMSGLRLCTMAQWEIRRLFQLIRHEVFAVSPFLGSFLAPKCVPLGYCDEMGNRDEHCPIRPHKDTVLAAWAEKAAGAKAAGRSLPVVDRVGRPIGPRDDDPPPVRPDPAGRGDRAAPPRGGDPRLPGGRRDRLRARPRAAPADGRPRRRCPLRGARRVPPRAQRVVDRRARPPRGGGGRSRSGPATSCGHGRPRASRSGAARARGRRPARASACGCSSSRATSGPTPSPWARSRSSPAASTGWHRHQRSEHVIVVFEGRGTVRMGSLEETLEPLRGVRVEMGLPHAITNTGRTHAPLLRLQHARRRIR